MRKLREESLVRNMAREREAESQGDMETGDTAGNIV